MTDMLLSQSLNNQNKIDASTSETAISQRHSSLTSMGNETQDTANTDQTTAGTSNVSPSPRKQSPILDPENKIRNINITNGTEPVLSDMKNIFNKYRQLEELIISKAIVSNDSMKDIYDMLKILAYNQTVLENRLEDALKNQMNTDILVNGINARLNALYTKFEALPTSMSVTSASVPHQVSVSVSDSTSLSSSPSLPSSSLKRRPATLEPHHPITRSASVSTNDNGNNKVRATSHTPELTATATATVTHTPSSQMTKRGPGRPRKNAPVVPVAPVAPETTTRSELVSLIKDKMKTKEKLKENGNINTANMLLPVTQTHITKSKRYFINPLTDKTRFIPLRKFAQKENNNNNNNNDNNDNNYDSSDNSKISDKYKAKTKSKTKVENEEAKAPDDTDNTGNKVSGTTATTNTNNNNTNKRTSSGIASDGDSNESLPRKRGRPPKKRRVETLIINVSDLGSSTTDVKLEHDKNLPTTKGSTPALKPLEAKNQPEDTSEITNADHGEKSNIPDDEESRDKTLEAEDHVIKDIQTNEYDSQISKMQRSALRSGSGGTAEEGSTQQSPNSTSMSASPTQSSPTSGSSTLNSIRIAAEIRKRQKQLDLLRDSREKMLVNMKYNDRERAKSFIESNKKILMAMKEEERRRKMFVMVGGNSNAQSNSNLDQSLSAVETSQDDAASTATATVNNQISPPSAEQSETSKMDIEFPSEQKPKEPAKFEVQGMLNTPGPVSSANVPQEVQTMTEVPPLIHAVASDTNNDLARLNDRTEERKDGTEGEGKEKGDKVPSSVSSLAPETPVITGGRFLRSKTRLASILKPSGRLQQTIASSSKSSMQTQTMGSVVTSSAPHTAIPSAPAAPKSTAPGISSGNSSFADHQTGLLLNLDSPIELVSKNGFFYRQNMSEVPITAGTYLEYRFLPKERELTSKKGNETTTTTTTNTGSTLSKGNNKKSGPSRRENEISRGDRTTAHFFKPRIEKETEQAYSILSKSILTEKYVNSLEYFLMEFRWENRLVDLGLRLKESKRTWQRRKALFALFEFWRDQSREKRNFDNFSILHAVKEMENYRIFINRSVSWFYNHITLLKMILYDLCDNTDTQWREWMFPKNCKLPIVDGYTTDGELITPYNINGIIDNMLTFDFLGDGSANVEVKSSKVVAPNAEIR